MPYKESWLQLEQASGGREATVLKNSVEEMRAAFEALGKMLAEQMPPMSQNVDVKEGDVDGIKYRIYTPKGAKGGLPLPVGVNFHAGGYCIGNLDQDEFMCRTLSETTYTALISVDYPLAPEHKWPAQLDACMKVYRWAFRNAATFHGDPMKFYTIGGSAGGGLALQVANKVVRDRELKDSLKGIVAQVPVAVHPDNVPEKFQSMYKAYKDNATDVPVIDKSSMEIFYRETGADPKDEDTFIALAEKNHRNFPRTYLTCCEYDPLRDDAYVMEKALKDAGVDTKLDYYEGMPHYFWMFPQLPESQEYVQNLIKGIEWVKETMEV